jgi:hypothetical protein
MELGEGTDRKRRGDDERLGGVPVTYAERAMNSLMALHGDLMSEKERALDLTRRLMEERQARAELEAYVRLLEAELTRHGGPRLGEVRTGRADDVSRATERLLDARPPPPLDRPPAPPPAREAAVPHPPPRETAAPQPPAPEVASPPPPPPPSAGYRAPMPAGPRSGDAPANPGVGETSPPPRPPEPPVFGRPPPPTRRPTPPPSPSSSSSPPQQPAGPAPGRPAGAKDGWRQW